MSKQEFFKTATTGMYCTQSFVHYGDILYNRYSGEDWHLYGEEELAELLWVIGRLFDDSPEIPLNADSDEVTFGATFSNRNLFYIELAKLLVECDDFKEIIDALGNEGDVGELQLDMSDADLQNLGKGIKLVFKLNELVTEKITQIDQKYNHANAQRSYPSYIAFCSKILHYVFSSTVFQYDTDVQKRSKLLFSEASCKLICKCYKREINGFKVDSASVNQEIKNELRKIYTDIMAVLEKKMPKNSTYIEYLEHAVREYAFCNFLLQHKDDIFDEHLRWKDNDEVLRESVRFDTLTADYFTRSIQKV